MWIPQRGSGNEVLCFGTGLGYLVFWHQGPSARLEELYGRRLGIGSEISGLATTSGQHIRVAVAMCDGQIHVHQLNANTQLHPTFSVELANFIPMSIHFIDNPAKDVHVFSRDGEVYVYPQVPPVFV